MHLYVCVSSDNTDRVWPAGVLCATALPGLWLAEDQVGGQPANTPHPCRSNQPQCRNLLPRFPSRNALIYTLCSASPLSSSSSISFRPPAVAGEVCDEGRGWSFFGGVRGDEDESSGQVPKASRRPSCPLLQPTSQRFPVRQGKTTQGWEVHCLSFRDILVFYKNSIITPSPLNNNNNSFIIYWYNSLYWSTFSFTAACVLPTSAASGWVVCCFWFKIVQHLSLWTHYKQSSAQRVSYSEPYSGPVMDKYQTRKENDKYWGFLTMINTLTLKVYKLWWLLHSEAQGWQSAPCHVACF